METRRSWDAAGGRDEEQGYRRLVDLSPDACFVQTDERVIFANAAGLALLGAQRLDQVLGHDPFEFVHPAQRDAARAAVYALSNSGTALPPQWTLVRVDGGVVEIEVSATTFELSGRRAVGVIARDITARVKTERERIRLVGAERDARTAAEEAVRRLEAIQRVTDAALAHLTMDAMLREVLARVRAVLAADSATILLTTDDGAALSVHASDGLAAETEVLVPFGKGVAGQIAQTRAPVVVDDVTTKEGLRAVVKDPLRSLLGAPLLVEGKPIGVLKIGSVRRRHFTEEDTKLLQVVADRVAPAIDRMRLHEAVVEGRRRLEALSRRLLVVQEQERRHVARELHDEVGQLLTGLKMRLEADPAKRGDDTKEIVEDLMAKVRDLSTSLMPPMLDDLGLLPALMWHVERYTAQTRVRVNFRHAGLDRKIPREVALVAFRVAQEALTNVARHTGVDEARLDVWASAENLGVEVEDGGPGFDAKAAGASGKSLGLPGMRERVRLVGGEFTIESAPGQGTRLSVVLPLAAHPAAAEGAKA